MNEPERKCRGTRDLLPDDMAQFRHIEDVFRDCCEKWGYREVRTPTIEYMHLFTSTGTLTPSMLGRTYSFLDWDGWSGERVVLRPDCTIPVARSYIDSGQHSPAKLCYVTNSFSFEESGEQSREHWHCGAEYLGGDSPQADAELIAMAAEVMRLLGISGVKVALSHVGVIRALLERAALSVEARHEALDRVLDGNIDALSGIAGQDRELAKVILLLLEHRSASSGLLANLRSLCGEGMSTVRRELDGFIRLCDALGAAGCGYEIDPASARGFEYYTGATFQFMRGGAIIGAGGRYDALVPLMGGGDVSACGFSLYMDTIAPLLQPGAGLVSPWKGVHISTGDTPEAMRAAFDIARLLRQAGFVADLGPVDATPVRWNWKLQVVPGAYRVTGQDGVEKVAASTSDVLRVLGAA